MIDWCCHPIQSFIRMYYLPLSLALSSNMDCFLEGEFWKNLGDWMNLPCHWSESSPARLSSDVTSYDGSSTDEWVSEQLAITNLRGILESIVKLQTHKQQDSVPVIRWVDNVTTCIYVQTSAYPCRDSSLRHCWTCRSSQWAQLGAAGSHPGTH